MTAIARLPGPIADLWDWQLDGSCRRESPDVFFHPEGERGPARRNRDFAAQAVCMDCPVLQQCRQHALEVREPYGVWGGLTEHEREAIYATQAVADRQLAAIREPGRETSSSGSTPSNDATKSDSTKGRLRGNDRTRTPAGFTGIRRVQPGSAAAHRTPVRL